MASQLDLAQQLLRRATDDQTAASALLEVAGVSDAIVRLLDPATVVGPTPLAAGYPWLSRC